MAGTFRHPFIVGERYVDRKGEYTVLGIEGKCIRVEYTDGAQVDCDLQTKAVIHHSILAENKNLHPLQSEGYFRFLGHLGKYGEFNAEVPPHSQRAFEERYFRLVGKRPVLHEEGYFPIDTETPWDKWAPELRIYFPEVQVEFDLPPDVEVRAGSNPGVPRINNNRFWWILVRIGYRLGRAHEVDRIRESIPIQYRPAFDAGGGAFRP